MTTTINGYLIIRTNWGSIRYSTIADEDYGTFYLFHPMNYYDYYS